MTGSRTPDELNAAMIERTKAMGLIGTPAVEEAFRATPRHPFLPGIGMDLVYSGNAIVTHADPRLGPTSSSSEIAVMAAMLEALTLEPGQRVLEIGAGTGYNAALLDHLVGPRGNVVTIENQPDVATEARAHLAATGHERVRVLTGDGFRGDPKEAPYDRIIATASVRDVPVAWRDQLRDGGLLVVPLRFRPGAQVVVTFRRTGERLESVRVTPGGFMPLRTEHQEIDDTRRIGEEWEFTLVSARDSDAADLGELLRAEPALEILGTIPWEIGFSLAGLVETDWIALRSRQRGMPWQGVFDRESRSLALLTSALVPGSEPRTILLVYGGARARDRLAALIEELRAVRVSRLRVVAEPRTERVGEADVVFEGETFRYLIDWRAGRNA